MSFATHSTEHHDTSAGQAAASHAPGARRCPRCQDASIAHSRSRGWIEDALRNLTSVRAYRCTTCWHRFYGVSRSA